MLALDSANINPELEPCQRSAIRKIILATQDVFALPGVKYTYSHLGDPVTLDVTIPSPFPKGLRRSPITQSQKAKVDIRKWLEDMLARGFVVPSNSEFGACVFAVYRGDKIRIVTDWRELNKYLRLPAHPLPDMKAIIRTLRSATLFSSFDIMDAFFMMSLAPESRKYTAFVTQDGLWEYTVCAFGLSPFPGEFQSRMHKEFQIPLFQHWLNVYIDDLLAQGNTWEEHLWQIFIILRTLLAIGARIKLAKAFFGYFELTWVGHKLNGLYLALDAGRTAVVDAWAAPRTRQQLQRFLGFVGYHQQFIQAYNVIARPLSDLLAKDVPYLWEARHEDAFNRLKTALAEAVVLYMPDFTKPFIVYTDACMDGLAAALYQVDDNAIERPIVFISRKLKPAESRYGASNLECLTVVWSLDKLHFYLDGATFDLVTDCVAVTNLLTAKPPFKAFAVE
jgi:hypothetical protein